MKKPPQPERRLVRIAEAAAYLGMHPNRVRQLVHDGELAIVKLPGERAPWLFDLRELDRWIQRNTISSRAG